MDKNQKKCTEHVFGKPFGSNTSLFRIKKRWFCKCYLCNTRKILSATLRCLECKVFVHDRCMTFATKPDLETENVHRGQTVAASVQDASAANDEVNGTLASENMVMDRKTIMTEPNFSVAHCNSAELTTLAAIGDIRISGLNGHLAISDNVHSIATAAADGGDFALAIVLQDVEIVPVAAIDVQYSAIADERPEIDVTGTSSDEIAISCHVDAVGTVAVNEKDTAVVSRDDYEVKPAPVDFKDSICEIVSQDNHELLLTPIGVKDTIPVAVSQDDHELLPATIDIKDSAPATALGQDEEKIDVGDSGDSASAYGPITEIDVTCSTNAFI